MQSQGAGARMGAKLTAMVMDCTPGEGSGLRRCAGGQPVGGPAMLPDPGQAPGAAVCTGDGASRSKAGRGHRGAALEPCSGSPGHPALPSLHPFLFQGPSVLEHSLALL